MCVKKLKKIHEVGVENVSPENTVEILQTVIATVKSVYCFDLAFQSLKTSKHRDTFRLIAFETVVYYTVNFLFSLGFTFICHSAALI